MDSEHIMFWKFSYIIHLENYLCPKLPTNSVEECIFKPDVGCFSNVRVRLGAIAGVRLPLRGLPHREYIFCRAGGAAARAAVFVLSG